MYLYYGLLWYDLLIWDDMYCGTICVFLGAFFVDLTVFLLHVTIYFVLCICSFQTLDVLALPVFSASVLGIARWWMLMADMLVQLVA